MAGFGRSPRRSPKHGRTPSRLAALMLALAFVAGRPALAEGGEASAPAAPAAAAPEWAEPAEHPDILVTSPVPPLPAVPERSLDAADVEAYGLGTVAELIAELTAEDGETREDAAFLVNGRRVPGLGSVADLPAEAVVGVDVLPRGSGVAVGAAPRQRVYNIRLRRALDLAALRGAVRAATAGGWTSRRGDFSFTHIRGERRVTLTAKARDEAMLLESERKLIQPAGSAADAGRFRSLSGASDRIDLSLSAADKLTDWLSGSIRGRLSLAHRHALLGPFVPPGGPAEPLHQKARTLSAGTELTLNAQIGAWQASLFANHGYQRARTSTGRAAPGAAAPLLARTGSAVTSLGGELNAFGPVFELPAGPLILSLNAGLTRDRIAPSGGPASAARRLTFASAGAALEMPIAAAGKGALGGIGDLSASAELSLQHAADFGSLRSHSLSLLWRPADWATLHASTGGTRSAPPVASLNEPLLETPGIRYFDPLRGETVDVTRITGGTPDLGRQSDRTTRLALNLRPFRRLPLRLSSEYSAIRNGNLLSELPPASLSLLQAFPERFIRDPGGRLIAVDARPVSFARRSERQIRTGLILNLPLGGGGASAAPAEDEEEEDAAPKQRPRGGLRPRLQISAAHSWLLASELVIRPGGPAIDLLSRDAIGFGGMGQPRHRFDASLGYAERGLGLRLTAQSRNASFVEASGGTANMLRFGGLTTFSLRGWVQGERIAPDSRWMKGTRISLSVLNVAGARERVADRFGATPLAFQSAYRDPIGRSVEIELRKTF